MTRTCTQCGTTYDTPEGNFWRHKKSPGGYRSVCANCTRANRAEREHAPPALGILADWPRDEDGKLLMYWRLME